MKPVTFPIIVMLFMAWPALSRGDDAGLVPSSSALETIHNAPTASDAVAAYAKAIANVRDPSTAQLAFINRMIDLGSPELAEAQARELTEFVPDGLAWSVLAFSSAERGEVATALTQATKSAKYSPNNDFVQKTAAQLLAWYDMKVDQEPLSDSAKATAEALRKDMASRRTFAQAYDEAKTLLNDAEPAPIYASSGGYVSNGGGVAYPVVDRRQTTPELSLFWDSPYLYPTPYAYGNGYGYGYGAGRYVAGYAFPQVWVRNVDIGTRYIRLPGNNGFILNGGWGSAIVGTPDYYSGYNAGYYPGYSGGYYPGAYAAPWYRGYGYRSNFVGGRDGFPGRALGPGLGVGTTRLSARMRAGSPLVPGSYYGPQPVLIGVDRSNGPARQRMGGR